MRDSTSAVDENSTRIIRGTVGAEAAMLIILVLGRSSPRLAAS